MNKSSTAFTGFFPETFDFLWKIRFNNERSWFLENKEDYIRYVLEPITALANVTFDRFSLAYPELHLNLHVSRIYRDARRLFGRGPYKDSMWFTFRPVPTNLVETPCFWFDIRPEGYGFGLGMGEQNSQVMSTMRDMMDEDKSTPLKLIRRLSKRKEFAISGDEYKRKRTPPDPALLKWYNLRSISVERLFSPEDDSILEPEFADTMLKDFKYLMPFYEYMYSVYDRAQRIK